MELSIIIVNFNVKYFLEQCLYSVTRAVKNIEAEIFVVDNHSTDGSREYLELKFPGIIFKWNKENIGFAKANNAALKNVSGKYILFLNPDTVLPEDCFEKCLAFFNCQENCGALGVKMIDGAGNFLRESKRSFPSASASFFKMTGLAGIFPHSKIFSKYYAGHLPDDAISEVDVLAGAFLMAPKKVIDKVAGFDEDFFMYGEDIDLAYRIRQEGFGNYYFPAVTIVHFKGESTQKKSAWYIQRFYGAMHLFVKKHYKNNAAAKILLQAAISFSKSLALMKLSFVKLFTGKTTSVLAERQSIIIAGPDSYNDIVKLVKYPPAPLTVQQRISLGDSQKDTMTVTLNDIERIVTENKISNIIFCEDGIDVNRMIELMQRLKGKVSFLFHAKKSDSIVGSDDKNNNGLFIAKKTNSIQLA